MSTVLVTGASGLVGRALVPRAAARHRVVTLSRAPAEGGHRTVRGDFAAFEDLRQLDDERIDALVHLASEVGGTSEEAGLSVNVLGTRRLMRYLADRGCRRFVLASSIAATGCLSPAFLPEAVPIADRHPCHAADAYGLSKHMVEGLSDYFARLLPDAMVVNLRYGLAMERTLKLRGTIPRISVAQPSTLPFLYLGFVSVDDMVGGVLAALEAGPLPGSRVYNLVGPDLRCDGTVADVLRAALGVRAAALDVSAYERPGRSAPPIYDIAALAADLGYVPSRSVADPE
jgi:UDP-glucose 4-epimerase